MKKIYTTLLAVSALYAGQAQVRNNLTPVNKSISGTSAFLDASSYIPWNNTTNEGKGLVFPRTNLVNLTTLKAPVQGLPTSFPNRLDGMIVYNTESGTAAIGGTPVSRGFYYYKNDSNTLQGGTWVRLGDSEANASLWAQRQVNGITETYLKPALANNDFVGYNSNRKYQLNLGQVTDADGIIAPFNTNEKFQYYKSGQIPYSVSISSEALPSQDQLELIGVYQTGTWKQAFFSQFNDVLKEDYVSANNEVERYTGHSIVFSSKDVASPLASIEGLWVKANHFSNGNLEKLNSLSSVATVGDKDHIATVEDLSAIFGQNVINTGSVVKSSVGLSTTISNYGIVDNMRGINNYISSQSKDETDTYPAHTIQTMRGIDNSVTVSPNASVESLVSGITSRVNISENVTMAADKTVFGNYNILGLSSDLSQNDMHLNRNIFELKDGAVAKNVYLTQASITSPGTGTSVAENVYGFDFRNYNRDRWTANQIYGVFLSSITNGQTSNYGLYIDDIGNDIATNNYSIYTKKGDIRFGKFKDTSASSERLLAVDTDGKLIIGGETSKFTSSWRQRDNQGVMETYLKPALDNNDFIGYNSNRKFNINLGEVTDDDGRITPWFGLDFNQFYKAGEIPYSVAVSSDVLPQGRTTFSQFNNILREDNVASFGGNYVFYTGNSVALTTKDVTSPIAKGGIEGLVILTNHFSNAHMQNVRGANSLVNIGDETHNTTVDNANALSGRVLVNSGSVVESATAITAQFSNYGTVNTIRGVDSQITSKYFPNGSPSSHEVKIMRGFDNGITLAKYATLKEEVAGVRNRVWVNENVTLDGNVYGYNSQVDIPRNVAISLDKRIYGNSNLVKIGSDFSQNDAYLNRNHLVLTQGGKLKDAYLNESAITSETDVELDRMFVFKFYNSDKTNWTADQMYGVHLDAIANGKTANYGLYIDNVGSSTSSEDYAVYTKKGNIRFGQLKGSNTRMVVANEDGVLSTQAIPSNLSAKWVEDPSNNTVNLTVNSEGNPRTNNIVSIDDNGKILATAFRGTNGATIFPDYVFENYYTGTSTSKADYNFANLSQVEDYVKANGHLPGYVSAKEIKAQGYIDIMDTQLTNVEKIEELYLHTIEQEKALKAKDAEIKELKSDVQELKSLVQQLLNK
ncbi:hypothetical protein KRX57_06560 [Weeksellaceae bacterium TAE3-ERU29]|nr:hypothetical protein [Weeksellaceae bacterium TAE3-ERU29]